MKPIFPFLLLLLVCFSTCRPDEEDDAVIVDEPIFFLPTIIPTGAEQYLNEGSDYIFDQEKLPSFELVLSPQNLTKIDADPAAEEYVEGMLIFEGDTISPVGIRYKGSIGAFVGCLSGNNWANPSGYKTCTKLSMKVKINWEGRDEKFYGLKKLQFHSQNNDDSQLRDRLGYWLFREMGVPGPRAVHARLTVNGKYSGLYSLVEQVDGRFTRYNFEDGKGNLYKEVWPLTQNGDPQQEATYLAALETNEDENPSVAIIQNFAQSIADASTEAVPELIAESMDIDEIISYIVVDRMIRHDDGPFHWYCTGNNCSNHNYYWYEEPGNRQLHLIPWDLDNAFENIISNSNAVTAITDEWGETSNNCEPFGAGWFGLRQWSAACDKLTAGWVSYEDEYELLRQQFVNGAFSESEIEANLTAWTTQIAQATEEASNAYGDAISVADWQQAVDKLRQQTDFAREQ